MADDRLTTVFDADLTPLADAFRKVDAQERKFEVDSERRTGNVKRSYASMGTVGVGALRGLAAALATVATVKAVRDVAETAEKIELASQRAGLAAERFQELAFAARNSGVSTDEFSKAMERFAKSVAEARQGTGSLYSFLKQSLPSVLAQVQAARNQSDALDVIAEAVRQLDTDEAKTLLTTEAFGRGAAELASVLRDGKAGLDEFASSARNIGAVIDAEALGKLTELDNSFDRLSESAYAAKQSLVAGMAPFIAETADELAILIAKFTQSADAAREFERAVRLARGEIGTEKVVDPVDRLSFAGKGFAGVKPDGTLSLKAAPDKEAEAAAAAKRLAEQRKQIGEQLGSLNIRALEASGETFAAIRAQREVDLKDYKDALDNKLITEEQFQQARRDLDAIASADIRAGISELGHDYQEFYDTLRSGIEGSVMGAFDELLTTGKANAAEFFAELTQGFARATMQALVLKPIMDSLFSTKSGGGIPGLLGGILPGRAEGGDVMPGVPYRINERKGRMPEVFVPRVAGRMVPGERFAGVSGSSVVNNYNVDARGSDISVAERVENALAVQRRSQREPVSAVRGYRQRFPQRA